MTSTSPPGVDLLGVRVHRVTMDDAVAWIETLLVTSGSHQVTTLNAAMLGLAAREAMFRRAVNQSALTTADGMGTLLVGRLLGVHFPERVAGVELVDRLCRRCAGSGHRVFFLGASPGVAAAAAATLQQRHPGLAVAGSHHGYFRPAEEAGLIDLIREAGTHLLFVALGSPRQELWLAAHLSATGARVGIGVGGSFDVYAGRVRRAPVWIRAAGLEWSYRLAQEPRRWRVAAALPGVILMAVKERLTRGWKTTPNAG